MGSALEVAKASIEAFNKRDWDGMKAMFAPGAVYDEKATGRRIESADEIIECMKGWVAAFSDTAGTIVGEAEAGDTAVLEIVWKGRHSGPLETPTGPIPASNREIQMPACDVVRVEGGKLKSASHYFDLMTMLSQIGALGGAAESKAA